MLTEKLVQYHSLLGYSQGCLSAEEVRFCYLVYSLYWDKPRLPYFIGGTCALPPHWIIPGFYCEYIGEYINKSCRPYWDIHS